MDTGANGQTLSPCLGSRIVRVCHKFREKGLELDSIRYEFHKEFLYELILKREGFETIDEVVECLTRDNYPIRVIRDNHRISHVYCDRNQYYYWLSGIKVSRDYPLMDILSDTPDDVISCGHKLPEYRFPDNVVINGLPEILSGNITNELNFCAVRLMLIKDPHEMYVHICGDDHHYAYHRLRTEMRCYDNADNDHKYRIPSLLLFDGLLCATKYCKILDEWHRCVILSVDKSNNCRLLLVDIGDVIDANVNEMRLLLKRFSELPAQALKVQLTAVRPFGKSGQYWSQWAVNLVKRLEEYSYSGPIECAFIDYRCDRYRVFIRFYDRIRSIDATDLLFLHQILVDKKLAVISSNDKPID